MITVKHDADDERSTSGRPPYQHDRANDAAICGTAAPRKRPA
jgi:hypothetical protein